MNFGELMEKQKITADELLQITAEKLANIPRGNTCPGVNHEIIEILLALEYDFQIKSLLDVPCGEGVFLQTVKDFFPACEIVGADIKKPSGNFSHRFLQIDAQNEKLFELNEKFNVITCISGVMEFDNTLAFFEKLRENLDENGWLIVTNDNLAGIRDRILYLLFGRFRQYKLFIEDDRPTWKMLHLQNLSRILTEAKFERIELKYAPVAAGEWVWLPFALPVYFLQSLYFRFSEKTLPLSEKRLMYPFKSLFSRHYVIVCRIRK